MSWNKDVQGLAWGSLGQEYPVKRQNRNFLQSLQLSDIASYPHWMKKSHKLVRMAFFDRNLLSSSSSLHLGDQCMCFPDSSKEVFPVMFPGLERKIFWCSSIEPDPGEEVSNKLFQMYGSSQQELQKFHPLHHLLWTGEWEASVRGQCQKPAWGVLRAY